MTIGEKIIELRKKHNLTQNKLAEKIEVSRQTLSNWESNITSPDLKQASLLADIFQISLDELVQNNIEIACKNNNNILTNLIGKECYLDTLEDDFRINFTTVCTVLEITNNFIKVQFMYNKNKIIKLIDLDLISSFKIVSKKEAN